MDDTAWICYRCGAEASRGAKACTSCGESLVEFCDCGNIRSVLLEECPDCQRSIRRRHYTPPRERFFRRHRRHIIVLGILLGLALLAINVWFTLPEPKGKRIAAGIGAAQRDLERGDPRAAEIRLRGVLDLAPDNVQALVILALALEDQGKSEEAEAIARRAVALDEGAVVARLLLAEYHLRRGEYVEARSEARPALRSLGVKAHFILGRIEAAVGDVEAAIGHYERAEGEDAYEVASILALADLHAVFPEGARRNEARTYYFRARIRCQDMLRERPRDATLHRQLARAQVGLGENVKAVASLHTAAGLVEDPLPSRLAVVDIYANRIGDVQQALREARTLKEDHGGDPRVWTTLARVCRQAERMEESRVTLDEGIDRHPGDPDLRAALVRLLLSTGHLDEARLKAEAAAASTGNAPVVCVARAEVLAALAEAAEGEARAALLRDVGAAYAAALAGRPQDVGLRRRLIEIVLPGMLARGDARQPVVAADDLEREALASVDRLFELRPGVRTEESERRDRENRPPVWRHPPDPQASFWRGRLRLRAARSPKEFERAAWDLQVTAEAFRGDVNAWIWLGRAWARAGHRSLAVMAFEGAIAAFGVATEDPRGARLYVLLAEGHLARFDARRSIEACRQALERWPACAERGTLLRLLGIGLVKAGRPEEALRAAEESWRLDEEDVDRIVAYAGALEANGDVAGAERRLVDAVARRSDRVTRGAYAEFLSRHERLAEAEEEFRALLAESPGQTELKVAYGDFLRSVGQRDRAIEIYREAERLDPDDVVVKIRLADTILAGGEAEDLAAVRRIVASARDVDPDHPDLLKMEARLLIQDGSFEEARARLDRVLAVLPGDPAARYYRGLANLSLGRVEDAEADLDEALANDPTMTAARKVLARIALREGYRLYQEHRTEDARGPLQKALELDPDLRVARLLLADTYFDMEMEDLSRTEVDRFLDALPDERSPQARQDRAAALFLLGVMALREAKRAEGEENAKRLDEASRAFGEVVRLLPDNWRGHLQLGLVYDRKGATDMALRSFEEARRTAPDASEVVFAIVSTLVEAGEADRARDMLVAEIRDRPGVADHAQLLGDVLRRSGDPNGAMNAYREARRRDPHRVQAVLTPAKMLVRKDRREEARRLVEEHLQRVDRPETRAPLHRWLGELAAEAEDHEEAVRRLKEALEEGESDPMAAVSLGTSLAKLGRPDEAIAAHRQALRMGSEDGRLHGLLADLLLETGRSGEAIPHFEKALAAFPDDPATKNNLAVALADAEFDLDRALALAEEVVEALGERPEAQDTLGWVLLMRGEPERAGTHFRAALQRKPADPMMRFHRAVAWIRTGREDAGRQELRSIRLDENASPALRERIRLLLKR